MRKTLRDLLNLPMNEVADWLIKNQDKFEIVPEGLSEDFAELLDKVEDVTRATRVSVGPSTGYFIADKTIYTIQQILLKYVGAL